jgi:catechol 2,3-dioxygenase-like lactoylglutathione lyase family enzyme
MKQLLSAVTIVVQDLRRLKAFYTGVLKWEVLAENEGILMLNLNAIVLTLCTEELFGGYTGVVPHIDKHKGFYLTINLDSKAEVDSSFDGLTTANVNITKLPEKTFWGGYSGFFADPEGNLWEMCYNPMPGIRA